MTTFRAAQVTSPGAGLTLIDRTLADPGPGTVRVAVEACGICHSRGDQREDFPAQRVSDPDSIGDELPSVVGFDVRRLSLPPYPR